MASALLIPSKVQESTAINCLFLEHLARHEYTYSLQVFVNESGLADRKFSREDLLRMLGMHHSRTVYDKLSQNTNKDRSLVSDMLRLLSDTHSLFESRWVRSTSQRARCATHTRARAHTHSRTRARQGFRAASRGATQDSNGRARCRSRRGRVSKGAH